jgi:predicted transcriptional regulator
MSMTCSICKHPERASIEAAIALGTSYRDIAGRFGLSKSAVERHASEHVTQEIKQSQAAQDEARAFDVVKQLREINDVARTIMRESLANKKNGTALFAIDRIQKQLELQAKLLGDLNEAPQVNVWVMPEWRAIEATIVRSLRPYPDARLAVANALGQLEHAGLN